MQGKDELRAGFVGLGAQGGPMAMRIALAGRPLTVWARRPEVMADYVAAGAQAAPDLAALGAASDVLGVCVFADDDVQQVADAALPSMAAGSVLLIHATIHPDTCRRIAAQAARTGVIVLDAPVSGGAPAAREGRLTLMVGGDREVLARCRPIIDCYAGLVAWLGDVGAGETAKLINNTLMAANVSMAHQAVEAGEKLGLDRAALNDVLIASSGASFAHTNYATRPGAARDYERSIVMLGKDVRLLGEVAATAGVDVSRLEAAAHAFFGDVNAAVAKG